MTQGDGSVYVYGVAAATDHLPQEMTGIAGSGVRTIDDSGLTALVSDFVGEPLMAARELRAHWNVLESATREATVLPVRFGTVMEGEGAVRERLLAGNADRLGALLRELSGRAQLSVKGEYDEEAMLRLVVRTSREVAALRERVRGLPEAAGYYERIRLGELVAAGIKRCREADTALVLERLEPSAAAARVEQTQGDGLHLAFLVQRDAIDRFGAQVGELADELGERVQLRCVGPLPPYSFVDPDAIVESPAWA